MIMKRKRMVHLICHKRLSHVIGVFSSYEKALACFNSLGDDAVIYEIRSRRLL